MVPRADTVDLQMSVDAALKYIVSMGVVAPGPAMPGARPAPPAPTPDAQRAPGVDL